VFPGATHRRQPLFFFKVICRGGIQKVSDLSPLAPIHLSRHIERGDLRNLATWLAHREHTEGHANGSSPDIRI